MATNSLAPVYEKTIDLTLPARHQIFPDPQATATDFLQSFQVISLTAEKSFTARLTIENGAGNAVNVALANMPTVEMTIAAVDDPTTAPTVLASRDIGSSIDEVDAVNGVIDFKCPPAALIRFYATNFEDANLGSCRIAFRLINTDGEDVQFHDNVNIEDNEFSNQGGTPPTELTVIVTSPSATQTIEADSPAAIPLRILGDTAQTANLLDVKEVGDVEGISVTATGELTTTVTPTTDAGVGNRGDNDLRYLPSLGVAVDENLVTFDGTTGKLIKDSGITTAAINGTASTASAAAPRLAEISNPVSGSYTLLVTDLNKLVRIDAGLIVPSGLGTGFKCKVFCDNASPQTLTTSAVTPVGNSLGNISGNGTIDLTFISTTEVLITGETEA